MAAATAGVIALAVAACGSSGGAGAVYSYPQPWGVAKHIDGVGEIWSAGSIPLCTKGSQAVTLVSITPVTVKGQIRLDRIVVRRVSWADVVGTYPGYVPNGRLPAGFVIPSPSPCDWPKSSDPVYETVLSATRTGPEGGYIAGLRVRYRAGSTRGEYVVPFTYGLCGRPHGPGPCRAAVPHT